MGYYCQTERSRSGIVTLLGLGLIPPLGSNHNLDITSDAIFDFRCIFS